MSKYIEHINIDNFKSIQHQEIDGCRRINVFIGPPNVGKSNILEAIGLYSVLNLPFQEYFDFNDICRVKHFSELYFNQAYRKGAKVSLLAGNDELELSISSPNNSSILTLELQRFVQHGQLKHKFNKGFEEVVKVEYNDQFRMRDQLGVEFDYPILPVKKYSFSETAPVHLINNFSLSIPFGSNLLDVLQREPELRKEIAEILKEYDLRLLLDTSSNAIMLIKELEDGSVLRIPYHQIADTLKRLIFYKAAIVSNQRSILVFEEPESHMFPPYISRFAGDIINDKNSNQYFIATHSPFVMTEFLEHAREELAIYLVGYNKKGTTVKRLSDDELQEVYQYGVDLFFNIESYLD